MGGNLLSILVPYRIQPGSMKPTKMPALAMLAMVFCQLGRAKSLREICGGLATCEGKLSHLGITAPRRSTLAYANEHRSRGRRRSSQQSNSS